MGGFLLSSLSSQDEHFFVEGICEKCSLRERNLTYRTFQFCTDELQIRFLLCVPEKKSEINDLYLSGQPRQSDLLALTGWKSQD